MKITQTLIFLILGTTIFSCNYKQNTQDKIFSRPAKETLLNNIESLLDEALTSDVVEFNNAYEFDTCKLFLFFKSGHILSKIEKNALIVSCSTETTYMVRLYSLEAGKWKLSDSISDLEAFPPQFEPVFDDYNFDGQTDLYIQVSASNGWSLSRGHLIIIDPMTKKFCLHKEARDFANMTIDKKTKTIKTELWNGYDLKGRHQITVYTNKWLNGQLKIIDKKDTILISE